METRVMFEKCDGSYEKRAILSRSNWTYHPTKEMIYGDSHQLSAIQLMATPLYIITPIQ
jgi:hypothetical protein